MRIRIYQIEMSLDEQNVAFRPYTEMQERYPGDIPANLYRMIYEGTVPAKDLSVVFYIFNMAHPQDYRGRSLSVSDVIEVVGENCSTFYYVDTIGFREVSFDTSCLMKCHQYGGLTMNREDLAANIENMTIGLDDTFKFHCTQCGLCCINREDIILSPMDIYKMSKELGLTPTKFFAKYCETYIGDTSRMPIIRLQPVGDEMRCPLLKNHKCSVHKVKPSVCALYPLGRYIALEKGDYSEEGVGKSEVKYLLQPIDCGDDSQTHTVREWLAGFDIKLEDEAFVRWHQTIAKVSTTIKELEKKWDMITMMQVWFVTRVFLYERYDTEDPFMPQFEENAGIVINMLDDVPRLKELFRDAGRS